MSGVACGYYYANPWIFFSVEGLRHHLPVRTKTRQQPPSRQKIKIKEHKGYLKLRKGLTEELKLKRRKKLRNESVSSNATLARHQKQNPAGLHSTSLNKLRSLKKLPSNCKASIKKQTYQRVDYIPEGRGACLHQA